MTAPVVSWSGEVGLHSDGTYAFIDLLVVSMNEARQIIAGLASVIT